MSKVLLDPLALLAILVAVLLWALSALSNMPTALWVASTIGAVIALGFAAVVHNGRKKRGV